ncbi:MAG: energy-coupling factor transporter transmembrane component T [Sphaerochaetaceae bacterium]|nr:energy-coupling factor transporter transmembrane component T [Sphaerochaetaceae bacterium]MDD4397682.1 energy-coupling factor transporter transmembrane component T [Sphaerochaetaceae bacterium]
MMFSYRPSKSFVHRANPILKLILLFGFAFCPWYVSLPVMVALAIAIKLPVQNYLRNSIFFFILGALIWVSNGWQDALEFVSIILSGMILTDSTDPEDLAHSLKPILGETFSLGISITLAMLPVTMETASQARLARKARGERFIGKGYLTSIMQILLDKADEYSLAYRCRME